VIGNHPITNQNFGPFFRAREPRGVGIRTHIKGEEARFSHAPMGSLAGVCIASQRNKRKEKIYEKTSFTSIGSNWTGSGSG
jgi:hypothetical protein